MDNPRLSVVIVNFETPDYTLQCLGSLRDHLRTPAEIIVVDNGSSDGSLQQIQNAFPSVRCLETGQNLGFAQANNAGIREARGEYVLLLNSDTRLLDNCIDRLFHYLDQTPVAGAAGPRQLDGEGRLQLSWGHFPTLISEAFRKILHHRLSLNDLRIRDYLEEKYSESTRVDWISGSCLMARKSALEQAGLLDGRFFMYFEDIDLCRRLRDRGWEIHYLAEPTLIHYGGVSAKRNLARVLVEYRRSQIHFTRRYYGWVGVALLKTMLFMKYSVHFFRWGGEYAAGLLSRARTENSFARLLICKQTLELLLGREKNAVPDTN